MSKPLTYDDLLRDRETGVTEHRSYNADDEDAEDYGKRPYWQMEMVKDAIFKHNTHGDGGNLEFLDQRGRCYFVEVSEDGLHVKVTEE